MRVAGTDLDQIAELMFHKKYTKIIIACILVLIPPLWIVGLSQNGGFQQPKQLSLDERETLNKFFLQLFYDTAGYVIYGDKPMSLVSFDRLHLMNGFKPRPLYQIGNSLEVTYCPSNQIILRGMDLWNKKFLSQQSEIVLKQCNNPWAESSYFLMVINKKSFLKAIQENESLFRERLENFTNAITFYSTSLESKNMIEEVLQKDEVLLGILLGYGRHNAELFLERIHLMQRLRSLPLDDPQYHKTKEELDQINTRAGMFPPNDDFRPLDFDEPTDQFLNSLPLPSFIADCSTDETQGLLRSYESTRRKIQQYYKGKDFVDQTLWYLFPTNNESRSAS